MLIDLVCESCGSTFQREERLHKANIKRGRLHCYCSPKCCTNAQKKDEKLYKCAQCGKEFYRKTKYENRSKNGNHFCSVQCAGKFNSTGNNKISSLESKGICKKCGTEIQYNLIKNTNKYYKRKYCLQCRQIIQAQRQGAKEHISNRTKGDLFTNRKNWQCARSSIRAHAELVYNTSNKPKHCVVCGYEKHYEICHIKSVSNFTDDTLIIDINGLNNLVALCPNHHWEFDNGLLEITNSSET